MSNADFLVKGTIVGMIASSAAVGLVHFVIETGTRWTGGGVVTLVTMLLMAAALLVPPVIKAWRNRTTVIDPFFEPGDLKPILLGRSIGIVIGIVLGISVVTGWQ